MIPFNDFKKKYHDNKAAIDRTVLRVFESGWFILGKEGEEFEKKFGAYSGLAHVLGVNSGTDALFLALRALGVGKGDEVITTPHTATPTVSAIRMTGATPVFVDIDPRTYNIDPALTEKAITAKTKVILPVHIYGYPADMPAIMQIARAHKLSVVEDVAQAVGATIDGRMVGTFGDIACFSFYPTKNLGAFGDGGAVGTNNVELAECVRQLRNYGEVSKYKNAIEGVNSRLDEIQAALLSWSLTKLPSWNKKRAQIAARYTKSFAKLPIVLPPSGNEHCAPVWHLFVIRTYERDKLQAHLKECGISTAIHYPMLVPAQEAYRFLKYKKGTLPHAEALTEEILSLPIYPELSLLDQQKVIHAVKDFFEK
jgi:dTDP-4-amino-4,6-dideoxygalactose transaminase